MKKLAILFCMFVFAQGSYAQTAEEVLNKFIDASGGKSNLNAIKTLQYKQLIKIKSPMGDFELPLEFFRENNKFYRMEASMEMGPQSMKMFVLLTDTAGYVLLPANPFTGAEGGLQKLAKKEYEGQEFQMDAAGMFAPLVNYLENGSTIELLKDEKVNGEDCYKLKLNLGSDQSMTYLISKSTHLVVQAEAKGSMAANTSGLGAMLGSMAGSGAAEKLEIITRYENYKDVDGIKFPTKLIYKTQMGNSESELTNIQINKEIAAKWYLPQ